MEIWIIILLFIIVNIADILNYYRPSIDTVVTYNKYRVLLWYNKHKWNKVTNKKEITRYYIILFTL